MKVTQEKLPASQIGLEIEITPEMTQQAYDKTLQDFNRSLNIPGFRKGKVPRQVLIQRFGTRIKAAVVEDLIQTSLQQALEQEKIEAIGSPELRSSFEELVEQYKPGTALTFSASVDVPPEVKLNQYTGLEVKAEEFKYDPSRVDQMLEDYRKRSATLVPVEDRPAQMGDIATVDFSGRLTDIAEGETADIPGASAEDFEIELAEGRFIPGFIDGIVGMQPGETKEVAVTFPEEYPQADLAGKPAVFTITLKELKERELPELDDDFAQEISEFETLAALRESLESRFQKEAEQKTKNSKQEALLKELVQHLEVELPESLIRQEVDYAITQTAIRFGQQGMDIKKTFTRDVVSMLRQQARPEAINRLKRTMALGEVAKRESIQVDAEAVQARMREVLESYSDQDVDEQRLREVVEEELLQEKIFEWLEAHSTVELVPEGTLPKEPEDVAPAAEVAPEEATSELEAGEAAEATEVAGVEAAESLVAAPLSDVSTTKATTADVAAETVKSDAVPAEASVEVDEKPAAPEVKKSSSKKGKSSKSAN